MDIGIAGWIFHESIQRDHTMTLLEMPAICRSLGVQTIELVSTFFASQDARYLNQLRAAIQDQGLQVRNIAVDMGNIANPDENARRTDLEALKQWFYVARAVGSEAIRINSGPASPDDQLAIERISRGYHELAAEAAHTGVYLLIENHGGASADPKNIQTFIDRAESSWFKTCPDTANFVGDTWEEGMRIMAPRAHSCHVKVYNYSRDGKQSWAGRDGQTRAYDLKHCLRILREARYQGPLCIEGGASSTEVDSAREAIGYVKELWDTE